MRYTSIALFNGLIAATQAAWWQPPAGATWQITLSDPLAKPYPNVSVFDFDLFDNPNTTISDLHTLGRKVICYFSAGSWENWRPDQGQFNQSTLGKPLDGWPGERWLDVRAQSVRNIMVQRMQLAKSKGCDAVDPDNVDAYQNGGGGFNLTAADAIDYVTFLANAGHQLGLGVGLKNALSIIKNVGRSVDFAVNEQCLQYTECDQERPIYDLGKPIFEIEYKTGPTSTWNSGAICGNPSRDGYSTLIKYLNLNATYVACPTSTLN